MAARWDRLIELRDGALKALEEARANEGLGSALNARVIVSASDEFLSFLDPYCNDLPMLFIVSAVEVESTPGGDGDAPWTVRVERAEGEKCERCWMVLPTVGRDSSHPTLWPPVRRDSRIIGGRDGHDPCHRIRCIEER